MNETNGSDVTGGPRDAGSLRAAGVGGAGGGSGGGAGSGRGAVGGEIADIASLFLSGVREKQQAESGRARPVRTPPPPTRPQEAVVAERTSGAETASADVTGADLSRAPDVERDDERRAATSEGGEGKPAYLVVVPHVGGKEREAVLGAVTAWASGRHGWARTGVVLAAEGRVSLGLADDGLPGDGREAESASSWAEMAGALGELGHDVDGWVVAVTDARARGTDALVRAARHWAVPVAGADECDMVGAYRTLKALSAVTPRARLTLVGVAGGGLLARRLSGVMEQFLGWTPDVVVESADEEGDVGGPHPVLEWAASEGESEGAWVESISALVAGGDPAEERTALSEAGVSVAGSGLADIAVEIREETSDEASAAVVSQDSAAGWGGRSEEGPAKDVSRAGVGLQADAKPVAVERKSEVTPMRLVSSEEEGPLEVLDLPVSGAGGEGGGVIDAVIAASAGGLRDCRLVAPGTLRGRVVAEGRRLVVIGVVEPDAAGAVSGVGGGGGGGGWVGGGVGELGKALGWLRENAWLVARACPELGIDTSLEPGARLYVRGDRARHLAGLVDSAHVTVHVYREVRWGTKRGVTVEAA